MKTLTTIAVGISLIILASGTIHYVHDKNFSFGGVVALVAVALVMVSLVRHVNKPQKQPSPGPSNEELSERMSALEKRLTDIQDIVISIDDRIGRPELRNGNAPS